MKINLSELTLIWRTFTELSNSELYEMLKLRQEVFIVEQNCPYLDCDDKDYQAWHLLAYQDSNLVAYTRVLPKGVSYEKYASIGRVVNKQNLRGTGLGKHIMLSSIQKAFELFPETDIKISAQVYALPFYESLGFKSKGPEYLEDNIPHQAMILTHGK